MPDTIRIEDLRHPVHSEAARAVLEMVEGLPFELSTAAVIEAARAESDVPLFEEEDLFARLDAYVSAVLADPGYNRMGHFSTFNAQKRHLIQRSRLEALYAEHPEIDKLEIERPLVIAGLPRSGTSHLLNLLGADPRLRALRRWESQEPIPSLAFRRGQQEDDRWANGLALLEQQDLLIPLMKNMYDVPNDGIHEEVELQHMCMSSLLMAAGVNVTDWMRGYFAEDQRPHYAFLKRALKALHFLQPNERWVMKSPQHMGCLPALVETFPDATFVLTHRDPVAVLTSWLTMTVYAARLSRTAPIDVEACVQHAALLQKYILDAAARDADVVPEGQVVHVYFHEFMADDMGTIERIYARAGFDLTREARAALETYIQEHPRGRHGKVVYDLEGDFGIARDEARALFAPYLERFSGVREEPPNA